MSVINGVVEATSNKFDKYSILVNGEWYSSKFEIKCNKGDTVTFDDGGKKYCQKLKVTGASGETAGPSPSSSSHSVVKGFPVGVDTKDRSIVRQNSLSHAVATAKILYAEKLQPKQDPAALVGTIIEIARQYESYSAGDEDYEAAKKLAYGSGEE